MNSNRERERDINKFDLNFYEKRMRKLLFLIFQTFFLFFLFIDSFIYSLSSLFYLVHRHSLAPTLKTTQSVSVLVFSPVS